MTYVVTENCIRCVYTDCVEICPADCFYIGPNFIAINRNECVGCNLCVPVCPVDAIYREEDVPLGQEYFIELNAELCQLWPVLTEIIPAPADAKEWEGKPDKLQYLER